MNRNIKLSNLHKIEKEVNNSEMRQLNAGATDGCDCVGGNNEKLKTDNSTSDTAKCDCGTGFWQFATFYGKSWG
ncbi:MAG: hypothetical protein GY765_08675 [bacterium]|nr:hypothetical protein [bacterium]